MLWGFYQCPILYMTQAVLSSPALDSVFLFFLFFNKELAQTCIYIGIIWGCHSNAAIPEINAVWKCSVIIISTEIQKKIFLREFYVNTMQVFYLYVFVEILFL